MNENTTVTIQQFFDQTIEYLRQQEKRSLLPTGSCAYLIPETGNRCAIGHWIPDAHIEEAAGRNYLPANELPTKMLANIPIDAFGGTKSVSDNSGKLDLAGWLQNLHDSARANFRNEDDGGLSESGEAQASSIAAAFDLTYTPPVANPIKEG